MNVIVIGQSKAAKKQPSMWPDLTAQENTRKNTKKKAQ